MEPVEGAGVFGARRTSFGASAATYDAVRPQWPAETVTWMLGSPSAATELRVVDLGAGTGLGTRTVAALGHEVVAVEPSDGMREALSASMAALPPRVAARMSTVAGGAEDIPVGTGSVDAVAVFQAWHWFDEGLAVAECARVLRPGGWLSMGWHHRNDDAGWSFELSEIVQRREHQPDEETPPSWPAFGPVEKRVFTYVMRQSIEDVTMHASTWSFVAIHPERDRILDDVRALARRVADADGLVEIPMTTNCYRLRRR